MTFVLRSKREFFLCCLLLTSLSLSACENGDANQYPIESADWDVIQEYEDMRQETGQLHTAVEYCENDIIKITISSRGQLNSRELYLPRRSVASLRNRDRLNQYPLSVRVYEDCIRYPERLDCQKSSQKVGISVSLRDSAKRLYESRAQRRMVPSAPIYGLTTLVRDPEAIRKALEHPVGHAGHHLANKAGDKVYTSYNPNDEDPDYNDPSIYIFYNSYKFYKPDYKRCTWTLISTHATLTSRANNCEDLESWKSFLSDFQTLSELMSKTGEFAKACKD